MASNLQGFLSKFNSSEGLYVNQIDPLHTFDIKMDFYPKLDSKPKKEKGFLDKAIDSAKGAAKGAVKNVLNNAKREIPMALFNNILMNAISTTEPPAKNGKKVKILYGQQVSTCPPTFTIYCNHAELIENSYLRYLENCLRNAVDFKGTPIKIQFKNKNEN